MGEISIIAGLGNPGAEYSLTRHNIGFMVTDLLAESWGAEFRPESGFNARLATVRLGEDRLYLCQPLTWMNRSGAAVGAVASYYHVDASRVLIVLDDMDLPLGTIRLRPLGGAAGHHGLESVISGLGTDKVARLRVGIGHSSDPRPATDYVLGRFLKEEQPLLKEVLDRAAAQAKCWVEAGIQKAMNSFNGAITAPDEKR